MSSDDFFRSPLPVRDLHAPGKKDKETKRKVVGYMRRVYGSRWYVSRDDARHAFSLFALPSTGEEGEHKKLESLNREIEEWNVMVSECHRHVYSTKEDEHTVDVGPPSNPGAGVEKVVDEELCVVCLDAPRNALLLHSGEVGHMCCCMDCAQILKARGDSCPLCRQHIDSVIRAF